jgi:hypothetical protein
MVTGKEKVSNKLRDLWVRTKNNFLVKINVYITMDMLYPTDLAYIIFITPKERQIPTIFMNSGCIIDGIS